MVSLIVVPSISNLSGKKKKEKKKPVAHIRADFYHDIPAATRDTPRRARYLEVALEDLQRGEFRPAACAPRR